MRSPSAQQVYLASQRNVAEVRMIRLRTYSDREALTVSKNYYWSESSVLANFDSVLVSFNPRLLSVQGPTRTMPHMPEADALGGGNTSLRPELTFTVINDGVPGDTRLWADLEGEVLEYAQVLFATALVPVDEYKKQPYLNLSASGLNYGATDFWYQFRGDVVKVGPITDEGITFRCRKDVPENVWFRVKDSASEPRDVGVRLPRPYGRAERIRCPVLEWVPRTTLAAPILSKVSTDAILVTDAQSFPSSGTVRIGGEEISYTGKSSGNVLTGITRGVNSTGAAQHLVGDLVVDMTSGNEVVICAADGSIRGIDQLFVRNLVNGELFAIQGGSYVEDLSDTGTISGRTISSATFSVAQLRAVLSQAATSARVSRQARYEVDAGVTESDNDHRPTAASTYGNAASFVLGGSWSNTTSTTPDFVADFVTKTANVLRRTFTGLSGSNEITKITIRSRIDVTTRTWPSSTDPIMVVKSVGLLPDFGIADGTILMAMVATSTGIFTVGPIELVPLEGAAPTLADLNGAGFDIHGNAEFDSGGSHALEYSLDTGGDDWDWTVTTITGGGSNEANRFQDAQIEAAAGGVGLEFYANVRGYEAPDSTYEVASGELIEHQVDVIRHWIQEVGGLGSGAVDNTSFSAAHTASASTPSTSVCAFDARTLGETWADVLLRMGFESRANIINEDTGWSTTVFYLLTAGIASGEYVFGSALRTISDFSEFEAESRDVERDVVKTRYRALYGFDVSIGRGSFSEEAFLARSVIDSDGSDAAFPTAAEMGNAEDRFGIRDAPTIFLLLPGPTQAVLPNSVLGYYATLGIASPLLVYRFRGHHRDTYDLQRGDIINVVPPWSSASVKVRVLELGDNDRSGIQVRAVKVDPWVP